MQSEARKKYTTSTLIDQKDSSRHKSSKRNKKLDITGHFSTSTFFWRVRVWSFNAEDDNILLQKRLGEPFCWILHCLEITEFFRKVVSCFMDKTVNICIIKLGIVPPPIGLELVVLEFAQNKSYVWSNQSLSVTILLKFTFLKWCN